ncbi:hypothetical protein RIF29_29521 [Crotalaria pallida]|uniref:Uncharacterized protein n=1 Tax=Crotalaria pallida TaxID=3830 RepID=A0AAN9HVZ5_CROPI
MRNKLEDRELCYSDDIATEICGDSSLLEDEELDDIGTSILSNPKFSNHTDLSPPTTFSTSRHCSPHHLKPLVTAVVFSPLINLSTQDPARSRHTKQPQPLSTTLHLQTYTTYLVVPAVRIEARG